ncbi:MAG: FAD-binding protein [Eubacteriales bacterium]|nr:FAD-binding protein [Eubacteriales bacterium]
MMETLACDVLVLGGGAAGIQAALAAARKGCDTVLLSDAPVGKAGSTFYPLSPPWGVMYAEDKADAQAFYDEIIAAAGPCVNPKLVRMLAEGSVEAWERMKRLPMRTHAEMGLVGCFGVKTRGAVLRDTGAAASSWHAEMAAADHLRIVEGWRAEALTVSNRRVLGAMAMDAKDSMLMLKAGATVLATGGGEGLYERAFTNGTLLGHAYAMAARHGARTVNLEFIQFINGTLAPRYGLNYYQFAFVENPQVRNARGEEFLPKYLPEGITPQRCMTLRGGHGPFSVEDEGRYFDLAIVGEAEAGNEDGAVITPDAAKLTGPRYAHWREFLARQKLAPDTPMTVYPFCQGFNGGVMLHDDLTTDIAGLYACGEAAGGCHGANRMGGNAILATQVFGRLAGDAAAEFAAENPPEGPPPTAEEALQAEFGERTGVPPPGETLAKIRRTLQQYAFLKRDDVGLAKAEATLESLRFSPLGGSRPAYDARNALDAAMLILLAMRARGETRGGHYRTDAPAHDPRFERMLETTLP